MPRRKCDARRAPYVAPELPLMLIDWSSEVLVEASIRYRDAKKSGALLVPVEIEVEEISFGEAFRPFSKEEEQPIKKHFSRNELYIVPVKAYISYCDAEKSGALLVPLEIEVGEAIEMEVGEAMEIDVGEAMKIEVEEISFGEAFRPFSEEEERTIRSHFSRDESIILVEHIDSNITITGKILSCLKPREWLKDEVCLAYMPFRISFRQEEMPYFRLRIAKEILQLKAE